MVFGDDVSLADADGVGVDAALFVAEVEELVEDISGGDFEAELLLDGFDLEDVDEVFVHKIQYVDRYYIIFKFTPDSITDYIIISIMNYNFHELKPLREKNKD